MLPRECKLYPKGEVVKFEEICSECIKYAKWVSNIEDDQELIQYLKSAPSIKREDIERILDSFTPVEVYQLQKCVKVLEEWCNECGNRCINENKQTKTCAIYRLVKTYFKMNKSIIDQYIEMLMRKNIEKIKQKKIREKYDLTTNKSEYTEEQKAEIAKYQRGLNTLSKKPSLNEADQLLKSRLENKISEIQNISETPNIRMVESKPLKEDISNNWVEDDNTFESARINQDSSEARQGVSQETANWVDDLMSKLGM